MSFTINALNLSNTGDIATDAAVDMSELDPQVVDAARITLNASDEETAGFDSYGYTEDKVYFAAADSKTRRMLDLVSDATNYVKAEAETVNFEETSTNYSDLFGTTVFEDRVLNDNGFLDRVVHVEAGFDEVFTNSGLYSNIIGDSTKEALFLSSYHIVSRGWDQDASTLWNDFFTFDDARTDTGVDGKRLYIDDTASVDVDADTLDALFLDIEWRNYDSTNNSSYNISVDGTEVFSNSDDASTHGVKTRRVDLSGNTGVVTVTFNVTAGTTPANGVLDLFNVEADQVI